VAILYRGICHTKHGLEDEHNLRKPAANKTSRAIKSNNESSSLEAQLFTELMDKQFQEVVSSAALTNLNGSKFSKVKTLPTSQDLKKFSDAS